MTNESLDQKIEVLRAAKAGKKIQYRPKAVPEVGWVGIERPCWDFDASDYRVAPEPREWWLEPSTTCDGYYVLGSDKDRMGHLYEPLIRVREVLE